MEQAAAEQAKAEAEAAMADVQCELELSAARAQEAQDALEAAQEQLAVRPCENELCAVRMTRLLKCGTAQRPLCSLLRRLGQIATLYQCCATLY